jgi:hypothetical protein
MTTPSSGGAGIRTAERSSLEIKDLLRKLHPSAGNHKDRIRRLNKFRNYVQPDVRVIFYILQLLFVFGTVMGLQWKGWGSVLSLPIENLGSCRCRTTLTICFSYCVVLIRKCYSLWL